MTSLVGINCKDGVVIGADSAATFGDGVARTIEQPTDKISIVCDSVIIAGTGSVGLGQRFEAVVNQAWKEDQILEGKLTHLTIGKFLSGQTINDFAQTKVSQGQFGALVAFPILSNTYLCEFDIVGFQPEFKTEKLWYCSMGSAQLITDPFLAFIREVFWDNGQPTVQEAIFAATWTLDHAVRINAGGVDGPVRIAVLEGKERPRARILDEEELLEHRECAKDAKKALRDFRNSYKVSNDDLPDIPKLGT